RRVHRPHPARDAQASELHRGRDRDGPPRRDHRAAGASGRVSRNPRHMIGCIVGCEKIILRVKRTRSMRANTYSATDCHATGQFPMLFAFPVLDFHGTPLQNESKEGNDPRGDIAAFVRWVDHTKRRPTWRWCSIEITRVVTLVGKRERSKMAVSSRSEGLSAVEVRLSILRIIVTTPFFVSS